MNKKELIEKYKDLFETLHVFPVVAINRVLKDLRQLDEPQKVTIPQFVADWYEEHKDDFETNLFNTIGLVIRDFEDGDLSAFEEWIMDGKTKPFQTLVNMHQFGYTVEKDKRYRVKVKGMNRINGYLAYDKTNSAWYFGISGNSKNHSTNHTRKELEEAGFVWVFDCPGMEVEEVEE